jgi:hypothetical protein
MQLSISMIIAIIWKKKTWVKIYGKRKLGLKYMEKENREGQFMHKEKEH